MLKIIFVLLMVSIYSAKVNAEWQNIGSTDEHIYFLDPDKIRKASGYGDSYLKVWVKQVIFNDITKDGLSVNDYSIVLWQVDCNGLTIGMKSYAEYKKDGRLVNSNQKSYVSMSDVIPNSIGEGILEKACLYK